MFKKNLIKKFLDSQATSTTDDSTDVESSTSLVYKLKDNKWTRPDTSPSTSSSKSPRLLTPQPGEIKRVKTTIKIITALNKKNFHY